MVTPTALRMLSNWQARPVSLVQTSIPMKERKLRKLRTERHARILDQTVTILKSWRSSRFEFEAACRHGIRSALCLEGWRWIDADLCAADLVARALAIIGAERPTWAEGQPEYGDNSLIERTRCAHAGCGRPIPDDRQGYGRTKYCSIECNAAATFARAQVTGQRMKRAEWAASVSVRSKLARSGICVACDAPFVSTKNTQIFCSHACFTDDRRKVHLATCRHCTRQWRPRKSAYSTFCSINCRDGYWKANKREINCKACGSAFIARKGAVFCSRPCANSQNPRTKKFKCEEVV